MDSTSTVKDLYRLLGVSPTATASQIKAAWRTKARVAHPDRGGNEADFHQLREAYEVLSDPSERAHYDDARATNTDTSSAARETPPRRATSSDPQREAAWAREQLRRTAAQRYQSQPASTASPTFEQRARARRVRWRRRTPRFILSHMRGAWIILVVSWAAWMFSRIGVLHVHNLAQIIGVKAAPSLSDGTIVVSVVGAFGLSWVVRLATRHLKRSKDFVTWIGAGAAGVYVEPLVWISVVRSGMLIVSAAAVAWIIFSKAAPDTAKSLAVWRRRGSSR